MSRRGIRYYEVMLGSGDKGSTHIQAAADSADSVIPVCLTALREGGKERAGHSYLCFTFLVCSACK